MLLSDLGVEYLFGVPGGPLTGLFEALAKQDQVRLVLTKHESGAAFMAAAYARVSGRVGVCVATSGPGATNALTGIASAYSDSLPVLLITGQVGTGVFGKGAIQESTVFGLDVVSIFRSVTKLSVMPATADGIPKLMRRALRAALAGRRGPVHVSLPASMLRAHVRPHVPFSLRQGLVPTGVDASQIERMAKLLLDAKHPCVLAGHGAALSGAHRELLKVADLANARVMTTPKGKGLVPETHPRYFGVLGFGGHHGALKYVQEQADVMLVVGSSMNEFVTNAWTIPIPRSLIHVDIDPASLEKNYPTEVPVVGDAAHVLGQLATQLEATGTRRSTESTFEQPPSLIPSIDDPSAKEGINPRALVYELRAAMPDNALLFVDNGNCILWATRYFEVRAHATYFIDLGLASMGSAVAGVVGGCLAAKSRRCVALVGDGAFAMHGFEVHTAVEENLPVVWVVLNDGGHGMVRHGDTLMHGAPLGVSDFKRTIDVAAAAEAMGAHAEQVTTLKQFRVAADAALQRNGPTVIDARIDRTEIPPSLIQRVETLSKMLQAGQSKRSPIGG